MTDTSPAVQPKTGTGTPLPGDSSSTAPPRPVGLPRDLLRFREILVGVLVAVTAVVALGVLVDAHVQLRKGPCLVEPGDVEAGRIQDEPRSDPVDSAEAKPTTSITSSAGSGKSETDRLAEEKNWLETKTSITRSLQFFGGLLTWVIGYYLGRAPAEWRALSAEGVASNLQTELNKSVSNVGVAQNALVSEMQLRKEAQWQVGNARLVTAAAIEALERPQGPTSLARSDLASADTAQIHAFEALVQLKELQKQLG